LTATLPSLIRLSSPLWILLRELQFFKVGVGAILGEISQCTLRERRKITGNGSSPCSSDMSTVAYYLQGTCCNAALALNWSVITSGTEIIDRI